MLRTENVRRGHEDLGRIEALYERAFPENERRPLGPIIADESGTAQCLAFYDEDGFAGLACVLCWRDIDHLIYFAVEEEKRGRGYGAQILNGLFKEGRRLIADLEADDPERADNEMRLRRLAFYRRCGFSETDVRYEWRGEKYVILSRGGNITPDGFRDFWRGVDAANPEMAQY